MADPQRVRSIFLEAVERHAPDQWSTFLDRSCGDDPELRKRVEVLLRAHEQANSMLDVAAVPQLATIDQPAIENSGTVIGPYKLIEQIGEGGMGTVWMAQQTEPVKRVVALKLIKAGMDSKQVIARFEAERQALALMDHANIARVLDAGTTGPTSGHPGLPYFVMDLVKGMPITKYCDEHHFTPRQRLELFIPVCQAIQHAHQKGIIHRDLKPSNVLVALYDGKPVPKVIDFGVAKAAGQSLTDKTLVTGFGAIVGTLEYMSPEQAEINQLDIDTRSDIYSLGVLLYELLAGSTPFSRKELEKAGMLEMLRVIREQEPSKPSTKLSSSDALPTLSANRGTEPAKLTRLVRGELDWIVMKALEKDRDRRYETANGFAADVQRYLADEAVQACPPSAGYRLRKFARRNKSALAVAALVLFFLVLLGSGMGWAVRDRAARQANVAGQVESILAEVDRHEREQKWPEALAAARRAEAAVAGGEADAATAQRVRERLKDLEFIDRLEQVRMRRATLIEGKFDDAAADREYARVFREYGVDVATLPVEVSIDRLKARPTLAVPLAAALDNWYFTRRRIATADVAGWKRLVAVARGIDPEPLRDRVRATRGKPVENDLRRLLASIDIRAQHPATLFLLTQLEGLKGSEDSLRLFRDAQHVYPGDFWLTIGLAELLNEQKDYQGAIRFYTAAVSIRPNSVAAHINLGNALHQENKLDEAIVAYRTAIELDPRYTADAYSNLGGVLQDQKKLDEAIAAYRKAIEVDPKFAPAHYNLGRALFIQGKQPEGIAAVRKAIELDPNDAEAHCTLGGLLCDGPRDYENAVACLRKAIDLDPKNDRAYAFLGRALLGQRKLDEALHCCRKAIELNPKNGIAYNFLGYVLSEQKKPDEAIAAYRTSIELNPNYAATYDNLGRALVNQGKLPEGIAAARKAIEVDPKLATAHYSLGVILCDNLRDYENAAACFRKVIDLDPKYPFAYASLGNALFGQKKLDEAIAAYRKAIELDPKNGSAYTNLGNALGNQKKPDEAIAAYRKAIELDPKNAPPYNNLGTALVDQKKLDEAIAAYRKAIELDPHYAVAQNNLGLALANQEKLPEAIAAFRKATEIEPNAAEYARNLITAHLKFGELLWSQGKLDDAIDEVRKAIELDPKQPALQVELARTLRGKKDFDGAVAAYLKAIELAPTEASFHNELRSMLRGNLAACRAAAAALEKKNPADAESLYSIACCRALTAAAQAQAGGPDAARLAKEEADRAMGWLTKAIAAGFADAAQLGRDIDLDTLRDREDFRKLLADLLVKTPPLAKASYHILRSQWDKAAAEYAKVDLLAQPLNDDAFACASLFLIRGDSDGYDRFCQALVKRVAQAQVPSSEAYVLARTCSMARKSPVDPARSVEWANQTVASSHNPWEYHVLGLAQYRAGQFDQALESFTKSNVEGWTRELNWFGLALVHHRLGHPDEARQCLAKGIQWLAREGPSGPERPANLLPWDWLEAQLLRREVEETLK